ncbi:SDR family NAD(P)-dependent oxidoreductase [Paraburkholderia agricolaris]|uniref:SDR family NAD(P)-dependent oxidoreductase n=1 Tax=Paraburkholderia agricolaris TaxID=2152888 RepID=A0ABW8ZMF2_9BURK
MNEAKQQPWVLVTGGARGIGKELVVTLSQQYHVVFTWRHSENEAQQLIEFCRQQGRRVDGLQCDGADSDAVQSQARRLVDAQGAPHALINNAGITRDSVFLGMDTRDWLDVIDNNLNASFHWTRAFLPGMVDAGRGSVVMMSSVSGLKGNIGQTNYSATKAALIAFARSLALEVARFGVRVNAIAPGIIDTDMMRDMPEKARTALCKSVPMKRAGQVSEVSSMVAYLIGDQSRYITGQCMVVDGGLTA